MKIILDNKEIILSESDKDKTIYEIAKEHNKYIPTACHLDGLTPIGSCRMCIVEVKGYSRPVSSCITKITDGMEITTNSEKLSMYRKYLTEFLFGERPHPCNVCVANNFCDLQNWKYKIFEITQNYVDYYYQDMEVDYTHKLYVLDHNRCILCFRCVRICHEYAGPHTLDIKNRAYNLRISIDLDNNWGESNTCINCGKCVMVCPTGALFMKNKEVSKTRRYDMPKFLLEKNKRIRNWDSLFYYS
jgi:bidirectional [NiFe] hydrogenase diaphorase subunit